MAFKEMDPDDVRKLLEGHEDVLTPMVSKERLYMQTLPCPRCGGKMLESVIDAHRPFSTGNPLPNKIARCPACRLEFDPQSGIITRVPTDESV